MLKSKHYDNAEIFFNKKRTTLLIVFCIITLGLITLSILTVTEINLPNLINNIVQSFERKPTACSFLLLMLIGWLIVSYFMKIFTLYIQIKKLNPHIPLKEYILLYLAISFILAVTPGVLISEPFKIFWLKTKGINSSKAIAIIWANNFLWHIVSVLIMVPSLILIALQYGDINAMGSQSRAVFWLAVAGAVLDVIMFFVYLILGFFTRIHYRCAVIFNWFKRLFKMRYKTKVQLEQLFLDESLFKRDVKNSLRDCKIIIWLVVINAVGQFYLIVTLYAALYLVNGPKIDNKNISLPFLEIYNISNVVTTANKYFPLPNGEFTMQWQMSILLKLIPNIKDIPKGDHDIEIFINNGVFTWRFANTYLPALVGLGGFITLACRYVLMMKHKKKIIKK